MKKMMRTPSFASSIVASAGFLSSSTLPTGARALPTEQVMRNCVGRFNTAIPQYLSMDILNAHGEVRQKPRVRHAEERDQWG
jgi:hypothetical protein